MLPICRSTRSCSAPLRRSSWRSWWTPWSPTTWPTDRRGTLKASTTTIWTRKQSSQFRLLHFFVYQLHPWFWACKGCCTLYNFLRLDYSQWGLTQNRGLSPICWEDHGDSGYRTLCNHSQFMRMRTWYS